MKKHIRPLRSYETLINQTLLSTFSATQLYSSFLTRIPNKNWYSKLISFDQIPRMRFCLFLTSLLLSLFAKQLYAVQCFECGIRGSDPGAKSEYCKADNKTWSQVSCPDGCMKNARIGRVVIRLNLVVQPHHVTLYIYADGLTEFYFRKWWNFSRQILLSCVGHQRWVLQDAWRECENRRMCLQKGSMQWSFKAKFETVDAPAQSPVLTDFIVIDCVAVVVRICCTKNCQMLMWRENLIGSEKTKARFKLQHRCKGSLTYY